MCAAHKRTGTTLSSKHLFMSDYTNLELCCFFLFFFLLHMLLERKHRSSDLPLPLPLSFGGWSECLRVQCEAHCHSGSVCNYCRSHCFTLKGCIQALELRLSRRLNAMKNRKGARGYQGMLILMVSLITGHFLHTLAGKLYSFQAINRNIEII